MNCCNKCMWRYDDGEVLSCVCEDEEVFKSDTQFTNQCIGYLEENFETNVMDLFDECIELLSKKQYEKLVLAKDYLMKL